jgi:PKHD-type hydroxylase
MSINSPYCYWYFNEVLTHKFCDDVIQRGNEEKENVALTGKFENTSEDKLTEEQINDLKTQRNSNIAWLSDSWIYRTVHPYINQANKNAGWNFDWDFSEACQFTKYKINQYYNWHCDSWDKPYDKPDDLNTYGKIRKLSVSCQLTDSSEYEGGELEFQPRNTEDPGLIVPCNEARKKGSIIVFPSHVYHRVKPVTKGTRYSLVIWNLGLPFK